MLGSADLVDAVAEALGELRQSGIFKGSLVVDPVMVATSGDRLMNRDAIGIYRRDIVPLATVITPNLDEGEVLLGDAIEKSVRGIATAATELAKELGVPVLLKGGHFGTDAADDVLAKPDGEFSWFEGTRVHGVSTHGTGCTLSAGIAAGLASGKNLEDAIAEAKRFVATAIATYFRWEGEGRSVDALNHGIKKPRKRRR